MKLHEETWGPTDVIVLHKRDDGQKTEREVLGAAAPDMARALVLARECRNPTGLCPKCEAAIDAALTKAGVLP